MLFIDMSHSSRSRRHLSLTAKLLSMASRNAMEALHGDRPGDLSNAQMRKINQLNRHAIFTGLHALAHELESFTARRFVEYHLQSIPSYWEDPELLPGYRENLEPDVDGAAPGRMSSRDPRYKSALVAIRPMLDRIAKLPEGSRLRGRAGRGPRLALERYGVDRFLKLAPAERKRDDSLMYLERDLTLRATAASSDRASELNDSA